jgi:thioredoxin 1
MDMALPIPMEQLRNNFGISSSPRLDPLPRYSLRGGGEEANAEVILPAIHKKGEQTVKSWFFENWTGFATVTLLAAGAVAAYCRFTPGCSYAATGQGATETRIPATETQPTSHTGDETVSTHTKGAIVYADEATFQNEVLRSDVPVLVDFYADWCGPCRALAPVLEQLAQEMPHAKIVKVDIDQSPDLAGDYRISSIPSLLVFEDGQVVDRQVGLAGKQKLKELLDR